MQIITTQNQNCLKQTTHDNIKTLYKNSMIDSIEQTIYLLVSDAINQRSLELSTFDYIHGT